MVSTRGVARLGMLAVGLGLGAAVAHSPVASADSSSDWLSSVDSLLSGAVPAPASGTDLAISFDGMTLVSDGTALAQTTPGEYSLAIAYGDGAYAGANGTGGAAYAVGSNADAFSGGGSGDVAEAYGTYATAAAGGLTGDTGADDDTAIDIGNNVNPSSYPGVNDGAWAGNADLDGGSTGTGSYDTAIDIGNNTNDGSDGGYDGSFAGAGGLIRDPGDGNNDTAIDVGDNSGYSNGSDALGGSGNYASEYGSTTGQDEGALAGFGNDNTAVADTSYTTSEGGVYADDGNDNYASVLGPENSVAKAGDGNSDIAYIDDPFGSTADNANGFGNSSDLAAVLLTDGTATAHTAPDLYDILTVFGPETGTF
jgi:hypothetical protein